MNILDRGKSFSRRTHYGGLSTAAFQNCLQKLARVSVIIHSHHFDVFKSRIRHIYLIHRITRSGTFGAGIVLGCQSWQLDHDLRAATWSLAVGADRAVVQLDKMLANSQAKPQSGIVPGTRFVLGESFKNMGKELW